MKIAIVHDWLVTYAGAERVLEQMLLAFPEADLYCVCDFLPAEERFMLQGRTPRTTFIQSLPFARRSYRIYLPLMPLAIEQLDLSEYDAILSSSHAVAKGVLCGPDQLHVSYVHTPLRYAWDMQHQYLRETGLARGVKSLFTRWLLHRLRLWDARTANGVDVFVANSRYIARRILKAYRRESQVIHPPVDTEYFQFVPDKQDYYLAASRLVPYKRMDLIIEAFAQMPQRRLLVVGNGPERRKLEALAHGKPNITLLGYQPSDVLREKMQHAKAFVFAAEEDFGITPLEAQACGTPVIAYGRGGARETIRPLGAPGATGVLFAEQSAGSLVQAVDRFERQAMEISPQDCRANALRFTPEQFRKSLVELVDEAWQHASQCREDDTPAAGTDTDSGNSA